MRNGILLGCVAVLLTGVARASEQQGEASGIGQKVANVGLQSAAGKMTSLHDFKGDKGLVVVFLSFDCPVSTSYSQPLATLAQEFSKQGIAFVGLTTNSDETAEQVAKHAKDYSIPFPVLRDAKLAAADALHASTTPEAFVLDSSLVLRYRGRIDNAYSARLKRNPQITEHDLQRALTDVVAARTVKNPVTSAIGCMIARETRSLAKAGEVTYHRDVAPILQNHCQSCHRPGEVGPFSLMTYRQAVNWAEDIKSYTQKRIMPPWKPVAGPAFHNERRLSDKELATLVAWVDGATPEGDPRQAPSPKTFPEGWQLGTPDMVLTVSDDFQLGPSGRDLFRCFVLPTNLPSDQYVTAVEVRPSNPRIVHHVLLFTDSTGSGRKLEQQQLERKPGVLRDGETPLDKGPGYTVGMGVGFTPQAGMSGWAPGQMPRYLPEGSGYYLAKNSDVVMQVHYHRNGRQEKDRTQVGLYFAKKKIERPYLGSVIAGSNGVLGLLGGGDPRLRMFFIIPAGAEKHPIKGEMWATADFDLYSVMPHMHMVGKEIKVTMTPPDGPEQTLVAIKEWDYNWQETYFLKEPLKVKAGTRFAVEAIYDNSTKNPNNPFNPPRAVTFGEQTFNEMCFVFLGGTGNQTRGRLPMSPTAPKKEDPKTAGD